MAEPTTPTRVSFVRNDRRFLAAGLVLVALGLLHFCLHPVFAYGRNERARLLALLQPVYDMPKDLDAFWSSWGGRSIALAAAYIVIVGLACLAHLIAIRAARLKTSTRTLPVVLVFAFASVLYVTGLPSVDLFTYLSLGEITDRGLDPYSESPGSYRDLAATPYAPRPGSVHSMHPSIYGSLATRSFSWLFFPQLELWVNVLLWKAFVALLLGLTALLLWDCGRALRRSRGEQLALLVMFAWSPVVLSEGALRGHVDAMVAILLALGLWMFLRRHEMIGLTILASVVSVKANFALLWPVILGRAVFGAPTLSRGFLRAAAVVSGAALFTGIWFLPNPSFGNPLAAIAHVRLWTSNSLAHFLTRAAHDAGYPGELVTTVMTGFMLVAFSFGLRAVRDRRVFLRRLARDYLLYLAIFGQIFYEWYLIPALVLVSVSESPRLRAATLWLCATSLMLLPAGRLLQGRVPHYEIVLLALMLLPAALLVLWPERRVSVLPDEPLHGAPA